MRKALHKSVFSLLALALTGLFLAVTVIGCSDSGSSTSSNAKEITGFTVNGATVAFNEGEIVVTFEAGTDVSNVTPEIIISENATVEPASGAAVNLSSPETYTVTAEDGTTKTYTVRAVRLSSLELTVGLLADQEIAVYGIPGTGSNTFTIYTKSRSPRYATISIDPIYNNWLLNWHIDGNEILSSAVGVTSNNIITIDAQDYTYGTHFIDIQFYKDGVYYSKNDLTFTVEY